VGRQAAPSVLHRRRGTFPKIPTTPGTPRTPGETPEEVAG
jgi:hypothetical protein